VISESTRDGVWSRPILAATGAFMGTTWRVISQNLLEGVLRPLAGRFPKPLFLYKIYYKKLVPENVNRVFFAYYKTYYTISQQAP
jgi:hypothetical protein